MDVSRCGVGDKAVTPPARARRRHGAAAVPRARDRAGPVHEGAPVGRHGSERGAAARAASVPHPAHQRGGQCFGPAAQRRRARFQELIGTGACGALGPAVACSTGWAHALYVVVLLDSVAPASMRQNLSGTGGRPGADEAARGSILHESAQRQLHVRAHGGEAEPVKQLWRRRSPHASMWPPDPAAWSWRR